MSWLSLSPGGFHLSLNANGTLSMSTLILPFLSPHCLEDGQNLVHFFICHPKGILQHSCNQ
jgi:hypothetical protein